MASEWQVVSLADAPVQIIDGDRGKNYPKQSDFSDQGHCLFLNASNVTAQGFNFSQCKYITEEKDQALRKGKLKRNDVIMTTRGTVGNVAYYSDDIPFDHVRINSGMVIFRADRSQLFPLFLYQILRSKLFATQVAALRTGSAQPQLPIRDINRIHIPVPPLLEQQTIAGILGTLDDKIELNRRMNETLEGVARAIFKSWFVDFDPVRAKAAGEQPPRLAPHIADLFPDEFEESECGLIPNSWKTTGLHTVADLEKQSAKPMQTPAKLWEHYSIPAFDAGRIPVVEAGEAIKSGKYRVPPSCVLVSKLNPRFPRVWLPDVQDEEAAICSTEFMPFVPLHDAWRPFLYELMKSDAVQQGIQERVTGSTGSRQRAKPEDVAVMHIVVPNPEVIEAFGCTVGPLHEKALACIRESRTLAALRDTLLPKLISGELRVSDAERFMEARI